MPKVKDGIKLETPSKHVTPIQTGVYQNTDNAAPVYDMTYTILRLSKTDPGSSP